MNRKSISFLLSLILMISMFVFPSVSFAETPDPRSSADDYLTLTARYGAITVKLKSSGVHLEYSLDGQTTWIQWDDVTSEVNIPEDASMVLRAPEASPNTKVDRQFVFGGDGKVEASGDVTSMLDGKNKVSTLQDCAFRQLFYHCTALTAMPEIDATTIGPFSCYEMFSGCTNLVTVSALTATTILGSGCYHMFWGCTNLVTAPVLMAATIAGSGCINMFAGCTNLVTAPALMANTVGNNACYGMFNGCTSLLEAPEIAAETVGEKSFTEMFSGCTSLIEAHAIAATTIGDYAFSKMFQGCTSLVTAPAVLNAATVNSHSYEYMFSGCTSLLKAPEIHAETIGTSACRYMFEDCTSLVTVSTLPATTVGEKGYQDMFKGCSSLLEAPVIAAETVNTYACNEMFIDCTSLKYSPDLTATSLGNNCYENMFNKCSSLVSAPAITQLVVFPVHACRGMFYQCTNLTNAPDITATTLNSYAFKDMFTECISLIKAPDIIADSAGSYACQTMFKNCTALVNAPIVSFGAINGDYVCTSMFEGCTSLKTAPDLLTKTLSKYSYSNMFSGCTSLVSAPALLATTLASYCYDNMFNGCTSLEVAPALPAETLASYCYDNMFNGCINLVSAPALPATTLASNCYNSMFNGCTSLPSAPALPAETLAEKCYYGMFNDCTSLVTVPALQATILAGNCCESMFSGCTSLEVAPALPTTTLANSCYLSMFSGCTSLEVAPALPATTLANSCYLSMFSGCTSLEVAPILPATTLANSCYLSMFSGCTSLVSAPALPAMTLESNCYKSMFFACTHLISVPDLIATESKHSCYESMFYGCTSLETAPKIKLKGTQQADCMSNMFESCIKLNSVTVEFTSWDSSNTFRWLNGVAANGTFYCPEDLVISNRGASYIPNSWIINPATSAGLYVCGKIAYPDKDSHEFLDCSVVKSGKVLYYADCRTIVLSDAAIDSDSESIVFLCKFEDAAIPLTLILNGSNVINTSGTAIKVSNAGITVTGGGTLTVTADKAGILAAGTLTVNDGIGDVIVASQNGDAIRVSDYSAGNNIVVFGSTEKIADKNEITTEAAFTDNVFKVEDEAAKSVYFGLDKEPVTITATAENLIFGEIGGGYAELAVEDDLVSTSDLEITYFLADGTTETTTENSSASGIGEMPKNAGSYKVVFAVPETNEDYTGSLTLGFEIAKLLITVKANNKTAYVNDALSTLGEEDFTLSPDVEVEWITKPALSYDVAANTSEAAVYTICVSGDADYAGNNYHISYENGTLTVSNKPSGGGGGSAVYAISSETAKHGTVTVDKNSASAGSTVTIAVAPDKGFTLESLTVLDKNGKEIKVKALGNNKYSFTMPGGKVSISASFMEDNRILNYCVDVKADDYYYEAVLWAYENEICKGVDELHFNPLGISSRAEMLTFMWRAVGSPEPKLTTTRFTDIDPAGYYYKAVLWAAEQGITGGTSETTFSPDLTVDRAQTLTLLARMTGVKDDAAGYTHIFTDVNADAYYSNAVAWAYKNKITDGTGNNKFSPLDDCQRAQVVTFLYRGFAKSLSARDFFVQFKR